MKGKSFAIMPQSVIGTAHHLYPRPRRYHLPQAVEGRWVDQLVGLDGVQADIAFPRTPDGHGRLELSTFNAPQTTSTASRAPVNTPGIPRLTFLVG